MNAIQIATLLALSQKSNIDNDTKVLINELIDVVGKLINEVETQHKEIDELQKYAVNSGELLKSTNEGVAIIMEALHS